jgi:N4-gp56 family major capsid protein
MATNTGVNYDPSAAQSVSYGQYENGLPAADLYNNLPGGQTEIGIQKTRFDASNRAGIVAATQNKIYQQYFDLFMMQQNKGMTFKVDRWYPVAGAKNYDMMPSFEVGSDRYGNRITKAMVDGTANYSFVDKDGVVTNVVNAVNLGVHMKDGALVDPAGGTGTRIGYDPNGTNDGPFFNSRDIEAVTNQIGMLDEGTKDSNKVHAKKTTLQTTLFQIGYSAEWTKRSEMFSEDAVHIKQKEAVGTKLGHAVDDLNQLAMLATTNKAYSAGATSVATVGNITAGVALANDGSDDAEIKITYDMLKRIYKKLKVDGAEMIDEIITGSVNVGTVPVKSSYHMLIHHNHLSDLEGLKNEHGEKAFKPVHEYAASLKAMGKKLAVGEVGRIYEFVVVTSDKAMHVAAGGIAVNPLYTGSLKSSFDKAGVERFDVYPILFPTKGSIAGVALQGYAKPKFYYTGHETAAFDNIYRNRAVFSGQAWYASLITKPEGLLRYDVAVSE